jgi:hypothetical protein
LNQQEIKVGDIFASTVQADETDGVAAIANEKGMTNVRVDEIGTDGRIRFHFENSQTKEKLDLPVSNSREGFLARYSNIIQKTSREKTLCSIE